MTLRATLKDHRGITLLDLLVALSLLAIGAGGIFAGFKGSLKAWTIAQQYAGEQHNARVVLDWVSRRVRMAGNRYSGTPIATAAAGEIVFFGDTDNDPLLNNDPQFECYRIYRNTNPAVGEVNVVYVAASEDPNCGSIGTTVGQPLSAYEEVQALAVTSLSFQYFDSSGTELTPLPLTPAGRAAIRRIRMIIAASGVQFLGPFILSTEVTIR